MKALITALAVVFIAMSFVGFYMSSTLKVEELYLNLVQTVLGFNLISLFVCNELIRQERNKFKYLNEYTLMVSRK